MKFEALNQPTETQIFGIPLSLVESYCRQFSGFDEDQLALITGSNIELTGTTDPAHHLLALVERPDLAGHENSDQARAYRAGICIGLAVIRSRSNRLVDPAVPLHTLEVEADRRYLEEPDPLTLKIVPVLLASYGLAREVAKLTEAISYALYTVDDIRGDHSERSPLQALEIAWHKKMSFMEVEGIELGQTDDIGLGISHTFRLYSFLEDQQLARAAI